MTHEPARNPVHRSAIALLAFALAAAGCGGPSRYVNERADLGAVKTVAVLPFDNVTNDKLCAERIQKIFITELLNFGTFQLVEPGQVTRALRKDGLDPGSLTPEDIKRLGDALKAQALFLGSVLEYDEGRSGAVPSPKVKILLRLVDTQTATTLWSVSRTRAGATMGARLFGIGGLPASSIAEELIRDELAALTR
jgi:TolB-like protein